MPQTALNNVGINFDWNLGDDGWKAGVDNNWLLIDALVQPTVLSSTTAAPPSSPVAGDRYLVPSGATGAWSGHAGKIAIWNGTAWVLVTPLAGWMVFAQPLGRLLRFNGTGWVPFQPTSPPLAEAGTARTFALSDEGYILRTTSASAVSITVPANASVAFPIGTVLHVRQAGAGQVTLVADTGVTLNTPETLKARKQHSTVSVVKVGTNEWDVIGDLELV